MKFINLFLNSVELYDVNKKLYPELHNTENLSIYNKIKYYIFKSKKLNYKDDDNSDNSKNNLIKLNNIKYIEDQSSFKKPIIGVYNPEYYGSRTDMVSVNNMYIRRVVFAVLMFYLYTIIKKPNCFLRKIYLFKFFLYYSESLRIFSFLYMYYFLSKVFLNRDYQIEY